MERASGVDFPPYMTEKQAAAYLTLSASTLRNDRANRRLSIPFRRLGRRVVYARTDLDSYLARHRVDPTGAAS